MLTSSDEGNQEMTDTTYARGIIVVNAVIVGEGGMGIWCDDGCGWY